MFQTELKENIMTSRLAVELFRRNIIENTVNTFANKYLEYFYKHISTFFLEPVIFFFRFL